jgi:hypothetical protein
MTEVLPRFRQRSSRYVLKPFDNCLVRYAGPRRDPWEEDTQIENVSLTGLAFYVPKDLSPVLGEDIKIQFDVPGSKTMACFAKVTRLLPISDYRNMVGVQFEKLELAHRIVLKKGLTQRLRLLQKEEQRKALVRWPVTALRSLPRVLVIIGALGLLLATWLMFMRPEVLRPEAD